MKFADVFVWFPVFATHYHDIAEPKAKTAWYVLRFKVGLAIPSLNDFVELVINTWPKKSKCVIINYYPSQNSFFGACIDNFLFSQVERIIIITELMDVLIKFFIIFYQGDYCRS